MENNQTNSRIIHGDSLEVLQSLPAASVDSIVTDPPYGLKFMGKRWDHDVPSVALWTEALRVLKPGGYLLAFFGSRTYHRGAVAVEDAGFEICDMVEWLYGSGFPKSMDLSKAIDKHGERWLAGRDNHPPLSPEAAAWEGWGTALKPAHEPIVLARKPLEGTYAANVLRHGVGGLNIDGCRVPGEAWSHPGSNAVDGVYGDYSNDAPRSNDKGRFPANMIHDGSPEVLEIFPGAADQSAARFFYCAKPSAREKEAGLEGLPETCAKKWNGSEGSKGIGDTYPDGTPRPELKRANIHPTVKPIALMRYLCRLITPPGGLVLDPFLGSGTTGCAAALEGFRFIGIEREAEYIPIAEARIAHWAEVAATTQPMLPGMAAE